MIFSKTIFTSSLFFAATAESSSSPFALRGNQNNNSRQRRLGGGDPNCNNANAPAYTSDLSDKLNTAMNDSDGFIFRSRFDGQVPCSMTHDGDCVQDDKRLNCNNDGSECGVAATLLTNKVITPNPVYCIGDDCDKATVGYAVLDSWSKKGGDLKAYAYYPTDSNSVDHRDWQSNGGIPGQGCHENQNYLCGVIDNDNDMNHCVSYDPTCKCDYDNFDPTKFGEYVVNALGNSQQSPSYEGQDFTACWIEESDDFDVVIEMQNSLYKKKDEWWNGAMGGDDTPYNQDTSTWHYQGWNEVAFTADIDDSNNQNMLEALVIVLPTGFESLCDFDHDTVQTVDEDLLKYWTDGYGTTPVVVMKTTNDNNDESTYKKETFVQSFEFESGNCIQDDGSGTLYYIGDGSGCTDNTESPSASSPTESPTSYPTYHPTKASQPGDCPAGYDDRVYIHQGCTSGVAGFAEDKDCIKDHGSKCEAGPGYYCTDGESVSKLNWKYDNAKICKDCASKTAYWDSNDQTWYCQL